MRTFFVVVLLLIVGIGVAGFSLGWFNASTTTQDGKSGLNVTVDPNKIKKDRDTVLGWFHTSHVEFQKTAETRLEGMDRSLEELKTKAKTAGPETKEQLNVAITELGKKTQVAHAELQELAASTKEGYDAIKTRLNATMAGLQGDLEKTRARFQ